MPRAGVGPPRVPARNCGTRGGRLVRPSDGALRTRAARGIRRPTGPSDGQSSNDTVHSAVAPSAMRYQGDGTATTVASPTTATLPFAEVTSSPLT